jgi:hypothetical protein
VIWTAPSVISIDAHSPDGSAPAGPIPITSIPRRVPAFQAPPPGATVVTSQLSSGVWVRPMLSAGVPTSMSQASASSETIAMPTAATNVRLGRALRIWASPGAAKDTVVPYLLAGPPPIIRALTLLVVRTNSAVT